MPVDDIPLLRLYRPPGDESFAFLERSWADSVELSFANEKEQRLRFTQSGSAEVGGGLDITNCNGAGAGAGIGGFVFGFTSFCMDYESEVYVEFYLNGDETLTESSSVSISEAFSSEVVTQFETAINTKVFLIFDF